MSPRAARWSIWVLLLIAAPLPYYAVETGREPVSHLSLFAIATTAAAIAEPSPIAILIAGLFVSQTVLFMALSYLLVHVVVRRIESPRARLALVVITGAVLLVVALLPVYVTPFSPSGQTGNVFDI